MTRPCLVVLDREHSGTLSMRKLVIESAKFNVLSTYSGRETIETFQRFPAVDGLVLNASIHDIICGDIISRIRSLGAKLPIIVIRGPGAPECPGADHILDSFDPIGIIELLHRLFPTAMEAIKRHDDALSAEENADEHHENPS